MLKEIKKYLKDNPKGYWFKRKLYGWGWTPVRWQGWLTLLVYILILVYISKGIDSATHSASDTLYQLFLPFFILTIVLLAICYWKGEPPAWQWGISKSDKRDKQA